ncbi:MAG: DNA repair protein RadC [Alphaproteobacteria bacterium]|nr:DNA repair protein RadC [Alphaproteobacteria bacterium]
MDSEPFDGAAPAAPPADARADNRGQRARMRAKFRQADGVGLLDDELLELVLHAIPRRDVRPLARALIARFGSLAATLAQPRQRLAELPGLGDGGIDALHLVRAAALRMAREEALGRPVLGAWDKVIAYVRAELAHAQSERFFILFLDRKNALIAAEERGRGTVDHAPVYPREVVKRALELAASAVILVHNHPSGDTTPSRADVDMTRDVVKACAAVGISVHDHLIVGRAGHASLRALGLM